MNNNTFLHVTEISVFYRNKTSIHLKPQILSSKDIYDLMKPIFGEALNHHEEFWIILLNSQNRVLGVSQIAKGGITETTVDIRIIFQIAIKANAVNIALCHNHPSGNLKASSQDELITKKIFQAGKLLDIKILDHLIISDNGYLSFADENMLF